MECKIACFLPKFLARLKECAYHKIQQYLNRTTGNCFHIVNLYFPCPFSTPSGWRSYLYRPFPVIFFYDYDDDVFHFVGSQDLGTQLSYLLSLHFFYISCNHQKTVFDQTNLVFFIKRLVIIDSTHFLLSFLVLGSFLLTCITVSGFCKSVYMHLNNSNWVDFQSPLSKKENIRYRQYTCTFSLASNDVGHDRQNTPFSVNEGAC